MDNLPKSRIYGHLPTGETVHAWTLQGPAGLVLEAITYGGIVTKLLLPDGKGGSVDVVLGLKDLEAYLAGHPYFGAIVGRVAGRITGGRFSLDGVAYQLVINNAPNHLHGGIHALDKKIWDATPLVTQAGEPSLRLTYRSPDGEEGYPGTVDIAVTYTVTHNNTFLIETEAVTDKTTPFSLTHHDYFNLAGEASGTIFDHELMVASDTCIGTDENYTLLDKIDSVDGKAEDLRISQRLGDVIPHLPLKHGALYPVPQNGNIDKPVFIARLTHPASGRALTCFTTNSHLQLYTASVFDGSIRGKSGTLYPQHAAVCLECEGYANGVNAPQIGDILLHPGTPQRHITGYAFSTGAK